MVNRVVELQEIEQAFSHLDASVQEHCRRVSRYAEVLFTQIVAEDLYSETGAGRRYLIAENKDAVGQAALYHDIGKAYVPAVYQQSNPNFTAEEEAVYRKHTVDGQTLLATVLPDFKKRTATERNIFIETIRDHHEYYDGTGFPAGKANKDISFIAHLVCIVNDFDHLCMSIVSEDPVEEAVERMKQWDGTRYDTQFFKQFLLCKGKFKRIFAANSMGSLVMPTVDTFVRRRIRPMELEYRPILGADKGFIGYDCQMRFSNGKENLWSYEEVRHIISKHGLAVDVCLYFAHEACDALRRFQAYDIAHSQATLTMLPLFFSKKTNVRELLTVLEQQELDTKRLIIGIPAELFEKPTKAMMATVAECTAQNIACVVTGLHYTMVSPQLLKDCGVMAVRLTVDTGEEVELPHFAAWVQQAKDLGLTVGVDGLDKTKQLQKITAMGADAYTGTLAGDFEKETVILQREIAIRQMKADQR